MASLGHNGLKLGNNNVLSMYIDFLLLLCSALDDESNARML